MLSTRYVLEVTIKFIMNHNGDSKVSWLNVYTSVKNRPLVKNEWHLASCSGQEDRAGFKYKLYDIPAL